MLSQLILASEITSLFDRERLDTEILVVIDDWFENIDSACFEPGVRPFSKIEISAHRLISGLVEGRLKTPDKIRKSCILPFELFEIFMKTSPESIVP